MELNTSQKPCSESHYTTSALTRFTYQTGKYRRGLVTYNTYYSLIILKWISKKLISQQHSTFIHTTSLMVFETVGQRAAREHAPGCARAAVVSDWTEQPATEHGRRPGRRVVATRG